MNQSEVLDSEGLPGDLSAPLLPTQKVAPTTCDNFRQVVEKRLLIIGQASLSPLRGGCRIRVEVLCADRAGRCALVVARDHCRLEALQACDAIAGFRPVADAVAERPDLVDRPALLRVADDGFERDEIGVDVGDN